MTTDDPDTADLIGQIIEGLDPGAFVTRFVVLAEVIGADGDRGLWSQTHDGATRWDTYGLLKDAMETEVAKHHAALREGED